MSTRRTVEWCPDHWAALAKLSCHPWCDRPRCTTRSHYVYMVNFSTGKVLSELELWRRGLLS